MVNLTVTFNSWMRSLRCDLIWTVKSTSETREPGTPKYFKSVGWGLWEMKVGRDSRACLVYEVRGGLGWDLFVA